MTRTSLLPLLMATLAVPSAVQASVDLIATATIDGDLHDLATQTAAPLQNGVSGNLLGGIGSGLAYAGGTTFLALPDRGPNAISYAASVDDTVSYIARFQTLDLSLVINDDPSATLPFTLTPTLCATTLLSSPTALVYGAAGLFTDDGQPLGSGAPALNAVNHTYYFTGRSDNFDSSQLSTYPKDARIDPESIRVSRDGAHVFVSDEYGPYVYEFNRETGKRTHSFTLPDNLAISVLSPQKDVEITSNTVGRTTNKGMEGLAVTPDGQLLVGIMQANLEQDKKKNLRIVTIDTRTGETHEYAYKLTDGSGVSDILAINDHQFLVDERDGNGMADTPLLTDTASAAEVKKLFLIDLDGAEDVTSLSGDLSAYAVSKTLFLDIVTTLCGGSSDTDSTTTDCRKYIPSKIEGIAFGQDVVINGVTKHTLFVANDNDFLATIADPLVPACTEEEACSRGTVPNPNLFYVFAFSDEDLSKLGYGPYVPQTISEKKALSCSTGSEQSWRKRY